jgi:hypothetical protein
MLFQFDNYEVSTYVTIKNTAFHSLKAVFFKYNSIRLNKKRIPKLEFFKLRLAGAEGLEPSTNGFGDRYSTN